MNTHVEVSLTVHFESRTAALDRADEIFPQNMNNLFVFSQLKLISKYLIALIEPAPEYSLSLVNREMTFKTRTVLEFLIQ